MSKKKNASFFECKHCGFQSVKWIGKCPSCETFNSFIEIKVNHSTNSLGEEQNLPIPITNVKEEKLNKFTSTEIEFDIVLGGGIVSGGLYLIGGAPGIGKSTLLLKIAGELAKQNKKVLYVSGEESNSQIFLRAKRCNCLSENLFLLSEINLSNIKNALLDKKHSFELCVIDSIQTIYDPNIMATPGSISQVRDITFELMRIAKTHEISIFIIGHITKDGQIAGPRLLEHMVDCVLYFEGDRGSELKILRGFKNRFGNTSEIGIFEMKQNGLISANEANKKFFINKKDMPGSAAAAIMEGSRCLVVEIQSLVSKNEYGIPKRLTNGFDLNRLNMLLALLEKKLNIGLNKYDVFINVTGGIKISESGADLALIASILSSFKGRAIKGSTAFLGEVSLIGDIRDVGSIETRLKELSTFGFKNAILPSIPTNFNNEIKCTQVSEVSKIINWM